MKNLSQNTRRYRHAGIALAAILLAGAGTTFAVAQSTSGTSPLAGAQQDGSRFMKAGFRGRHGRRGGRRGGGMMGELFRQADADKDGAVTKAEIDTFRQAQLQGADTDGNGDLTLAEFERVWLSLTRNRMVDAFQALDEDGSGQITTAEIDDRLNRIMQRMDRNGDGKLDRSDRGRRGRDRN